MSRKVLIINLEFPPIGGPGVQRVLKFVKYLPEEGWTPTVICGDRSIWHDRRDWTLVSEIPGDVDVLRVSFSTIEDSSRIASAISYFVLYPLRLYLSKEKMRVELRQILLNMLCYIHPEPFLWWVYLGSREALQCHRKHCFDVVLTSGPPHITHMIGFLLKELRRIKWVADFRDPWVDSQVQAERLGISRRLDRVWERLVLRNADGIVCVSPTWARLLSGKLGRRNGSKVHIVYNGYDPEDIPYYSVGSVNSESGSDVLHIHYNGTIQGPMLPTVFFKALARLREKMADVQAFVRCTFTGLPADVARLVDEFGLRTVVTDIGQLCHHESLEMAARADVLLLILNEADKTYGGQLTGKVYEYLATGKSILAIIPHDGDLRTLLEGYEGSYIVNCENLVGIVEILRLLMRKKREGQLDGIQPPSWIARYSRQAQTRRLAAILDDI